MTNLELKEKAAKELRYKVSQIKKVEVGEDNVFVRLNNGDSRLIPTQVWNNKITEQEFAKQKTTESQALNKKWRAETQDWVTKFSAK